MADIKNTFLKGKMNKDLDDRLIPNGEYREAINLNITKSEASDVGALSSVQPNIQLEATTIYSALGNPAGLTTIGFYVNSETGFLYWFIVYLKKYGWIIKVIYTFTIICRLLINFKNCIFSNSM